MLAVEGRSNICARTANHCRMALESFGIRKYARPLAADRQNGIKRWRAAQYVCC
jgi:hypothetical protein